MKITNLFNLPQAIYTKIISGVYDPDPNRIGATTLIDAPLKRKLKLKHWDELTEDASDRLWALFGTAVHAILDGQVANALTEERLEYKHDSGLLLVGYPDIYHEGIVRDFKVTSVWSLVYGNDKYEPQLNVNAELLERHGFKVDGCVIDMILRDFQSSKAGQDNYPQIPFVSKEYTLWDRDTRNNYIDERMKLHTATDVPPCTPEEMWEKPTTYAVKGKNRKTAFRVLDSKEDAEKWIKDNGKGDYIETRDGERTCCKSYCAVRSVCPHNIYRDEVDNENQSA